MDALPWRAEHAPSPEDLARALACQFPQLRGAPVRPLAEGWDNFTFEVGTQWVFRVPKRRDVELALARERAVLSRIADVVPIAVPRFRFIGWPSEHVPYCFVGYRKLSGEPLRQRARCIVQPRRAKERFARQMGAFLSRLHTLSCARLDLDLPVDQPAAIATDPLTHDGSLLMHLAAEDTALFQRVVEYIGRRSGGAPRCDAPVLVHGDLDPDQIIVDPRRARVAGVIDWGNARISAPAVDFASILGFGGRPLLQMVLRHYRGPPDAGALDWLSRRSLYLCLRSLSYGRLAGRPRDVAAALAGIRNSLC